MPQLVCALCVRLGFSEKKKSFFYLHSLEKRVSADLEEMTNHPIEGVACIPKPNNLGIWQVFVEG
jgi:hypothetical protein